MASESGVQITTPQSGEMDIEHEVKSVQLAMSDVTTAEIIRATMLVGFGALEGYAFATSGMSYPETFRSQMDFSRNILLQLFMSAVGSSMIAQSVLNLIAPDKFDNSRVWKYTSVGYKRVVVGCSILGAGMAIGGSGPTMLPTQVAVGTKNSLLTLLGAVVGGAVFSALEQHGYFSTDTDAKRGEKLTVEQHLGGHYSLWSGAIGAALIGGALAVPILIDTSKDQSSLSPLLTTAPVVAGLSVGLNQIPMRLISECGQGGSRSLMQLVHFFTGGKLAKRFRLKKISCGNQLWYVWGGTLIGALVASAHLSLPAPTGYSAFDAFIGGALMLFGSRVAAGCACGHGVSGFSELSLQSMAGAAAIFGCGILTKFVLGLKN